MKISTKGRYAIRMLADLAQHGGDGYVSLKDVADRQGISKKYLEQIIPLFNRSDVLLTSRGFQGGYRLARKPEEYTLGEILRLTEGSIAPVSCLEGEENHCPRRDACVTLPVWQGLYDAIRTYLDGVTLQDVLDQAAERGDYYII